MYLCTCVPVYLCTCVPVYLCTCVPVYLCTCVPVYLCFCSHKKSQKKTTRPKKMGELLAEFGRVAELFLTRRAPMPRGGGGTWGVGILYFCYCQKLCSCLLLMNGIFTLYPHCFFIYASTYNGAIGNRSTTCQRPVNIGGCALFIFTIAFCLFVCGVFPSPKIVREI